MTAQRTKLTAAITCKILGTSISDLKLLHQIPVTTVYFHLTTFFLKMVQQLVQQRVLMVFLDETSNYLFDEVRTLLRVGVGDIALIKTHNQPIPGRRQSIKRHSSTTTRFVEQAQTQLLLRFIQLTCEGHNTKIQVRVS